MSTLPADVRRLIEAAFESVAQLEVLLCLHAGSRAWTPAELASHLKSQPDVVEANLSRLAAGGLVKAHVTEDAVSFAYAAGGARARTVDKLASLYKSHRVAVVEAIFSAPEDPLADFADAFRMRDD
jgi:hypothetical protein